MARRVVWSAEAQTNLIQIREYIGQFAPLAAHRFSLRLVRAAESLCLNAERGRPVGDGLRELTIIAPYLIRYEVMGAEIHILRIRHGARLLDDGI